MAASAAQSVRIDNSSSVDEEAIIVLETSDIRGGLERRSKSLMGRLMADRSFSVGTIEVALHSIWRQPNGFKVIDHGGNKFQSFFEEEKYLIRIERGSRKGRQYCEGIGLDVRNCSMQIDDSLKGELQDEKWGEWLRSDQGGRREIAWKENINPNVHHQESSIQNNHGKPIPVNLIKSLANLSMQSHNTLQDRGEEEVTSKAVVTTKDNAMDHGSAQQPIPAMLKDGIQENFVFASKENSLTNTKRITLKQQARRRYVHVAGVKRGM
ncbi:hypothetical protein PIB30_052943 [Stylosanthes scabra]|uniref:DUF4283 domain-containing protein n=1 Tax=Stylosanthes scabra TaxID=79078 RepID=A0ABU6YH64_9FABA|nr:hypothetical protein [Stylosanthes scabra]